MASVEWLFFYFTNIPRIVEKDMVNNVNKINSIGVTNLVSEKKVGDKTVFLCDICRLGYADRKTAQDCEDYCRAHPGECSAEIAEKAVYTPGAPMLPKKK